MAENYWNQYDSLEALDTWESTIYPGLTAKQIKYNDKTAIVTIGTVPGLTKAKHKEFRENVVENTKIANPNVTMEVLPDVDGYKNYFAHIKTPMVMSDRNLITLMTVRENADGSDYIVSTSRGTEPIVEKLKDKIGKNVIAIQEFQIGKITDTEQGLKMQGCVCVDLSGSIPTFFQNKMTARGMKGIERGAYIMLNGKAPDE